jgi:hypothetical protein
MIDKRFKVGDIIHCESDFPGNSINEDVLLLHLSEKYRNCWYVENIKTHKKYDLNESYFKYKMTPIIKNSNIKDSKLLRWLKREK